MCQKGFYEYSLLNLDMNETDFKTIDVGELQERQ